MNKQGKDKISWCDFSWNPLCGCNHGCNFCYARGIANRFKGTKAFPNGFEITYHEERFIHPYKLRKPSKIFVCSMGDLFCKDVDRGFINKVLNVAKENPKHIFMFLTKNPERYNEFEFFDNCWCGFSATNQKDYNDRVGNLHGTPRHTFVSLEPMQEEISLLEAGIIPQWIIIGQETGHRENKIKVKEEWVQKLLCEVIELSERRNIAIHIKKNVQYREYPEAMNEYFYRNKLKESI